MLMAQHRPGGAALAVTMLIALSYVAMRTGRAAAVPPGTAPNSVLTFHTFDIEEVFSSSDGLVQFIELLETTGADGHHHFGGNQLRSGTNVFTYPNDLPDPATANRSVLIATAGFAALPGAVTPDYIIPDRFFEVTGDTISIFEAEVNLMVDTFVFGGLPQDPCTCNGDVDNSGTVDALDGVCIMDCRGGDCSCCLSSCDVNCDGVVDTGDIGDDILNDPSAWLCLFEGGPSETCCPDPTGACCDASTGGCANGAAEGECAGLDVTWSEGLTCVQVTCLGPPTGACCDLDFGTCEEEVLSANCSGANHLWSEGLSCLAAACPVPPGGACCNLGNGLCTDGVVAAECDGPDLVWTNSTLCSAVECSVPPQDPCTCDGDVDNSGQVDILDGVCIADCKAGGCSCCLSSCDVNCDGVVDAGDAGDDILNDPSTWLCLFQGGSPEVCCPGPAAASSLVPPDGACCNVGNGQCFDGVPEVDCTGGRLVWTESTMCSALSCVDAFLPTDGALSLKSDGTTDVNSPTNFSGEMGSVNAASPSIPTMSRTSLVVMMLLLVTAAVAITRTRGRGISPST